MIASGQKHRIKASAENIYYTSDSDACRLFLPALVAGEATAEVGRSLGFLFLEFGQDGRSIK